MPAVSRNTLGVNVGTLDSPDRKLVLNSGSNVQYSRGHIFFVRGASLMAQPFDVERLELNGDAVPIAEQVAIRPITLTPSALLEAGAFSVSETGVLVYQVGSSEVRCQLVWFDRTGKQIGVVGDQGDYADLELSPDRSRAAVAVMDATRRTRDIWLFDMARGLRTTRVTLDPASDQAPVWSPDGGRLAYLSGRGGPDNEMRQVSATGTGSDELIGHGNPRSWSPDGRFIVYNISGTGGTNGGTNNDLWVLPTAGDRKPFPFLSAPFNELFGKFSPDGRWIVYHSNESGQNEVYVAPFPGPGEKWRISTNGGWYARWRRDGKEICYLSLDNRLIVAEVNAEGSAFNVGAAGPLFATNPRIAGYPYDISADGQQVLVLVRMDAGNAPAPSSAAGRSPITLVVNWPALLKQ